MFEAMFEEFGVIDEKADFEMAENGFVLRVAGRRASDEMWITRSYVFVGQHDFLVAIKKLAEKERT